jgi:hypothetical protein
MIQIISAFFFISYLRHLNHVLTTIEYSVSLSPVDYTLLMYVRKLNLNNESVLPGLLGGLSDVN